MRIWHCALCLALATLAHSADAPSVGSGFLDRVVTVDGAEYRYQVFVPAGWSKSMGWPVILALHGAGGYGMLIGPAATKAEIEIFRQQIIATPERYIAQPTLALSTCPTFVAQGLAPRHIDLRPFVLSGRDVTIVPGGLTRVALLEGSLVVNSSQGGGTKDTWVLEA